MSKIFHINYSISIFIIIITETHHACVHPDKPAYYGINSGALRWVYVYLS